MIFDNIRKFVFYLFSCNLAEILVLLGAGLAGLPAAAAAAADPVAQPADRYLSGAGARGRAGRAGDHAAAAARSARRRSCPARWFARRWPTPPSSAASTLGAPSCGAAPAARTAARATTLAFMTLALAQIFHLGNARSVLPVTTIHRVLANPHALVAVGLSIGLLALAFHVPILSEVLDLHSLSGRDWLVINGLGLVPGITGQTVKWLRARWRSRGNS